MDSLELFGFPSEWSGKPLLGVVLYTLFKFNSFGFTEEFRSSLHTASSNVPILHKHGPLIKMKKLTLVQRN